MSYGAAKAAQENYTLAAATELADQGITANVVYPPVTDTGWVTDEVRRFVARSQEHTHVASPAQVALLCGRRPGQRQRAPPALRCWPVSTVSARRDAILRYHRAQRSYMTDILIRNLAPDVVASLDELAARVGLSRGEYLRRRLTEEASRSHAPVSVASFARFSHTFADLVDDEVMDRAWR